MVKAQIGLQPDTAEKLVNVSKGKNCLSIETSGQFGPILTCGQFDHKLETFEELAKEYGVRRLGS